jgi:Ca2+-binding RTX toxin-like protein
VWTRTRWLAVIVLLQLTFVPPASAIVKVFPFVGPGQSHRLLVEDRPAGRDLDRVIFGYADALSAYGITSSAGFETPLPAECDQTGSTTADCADPTGSGDVVLVANLNDRDTVRIAAGTPYRLSILRAGSRLIGAAGRDRLTAGDTGRLEGSGGDDVLRGGRTLLGGAGGDKLSGLAGRDAFRGGSGGDLIRADDGTRDVVRCGPGEDTARIDRADRPARGCEVVRLAPASRR